MLDSAHVLRNSEAVRRALLRRHLDPHFVDETFSLLDARRRAQQEKETLQREQNEASEQMRRSAQAGEQAQMHSARGALQALKQRVQQSQEAFAQADAAAAERLLLVANLPLDAVPNGGDEKDNKELRRVGTLPVLPHARAHYELGEALGIVDFARAGLTSGARYSYLLGGAAELERALANFMLDQARAHGHRQVSPPLLVRPEAMQQSGQYPKFIGESFETLEREAVLIPTSEVSLLALHAGEIVPQEALPLRYAAMTPCFRREAGAAGRDTRGLIRQHQFYKVELVSFTTPETSADEHERMVGCAEGILQALELPYRTMHLCAGDMGFAAASTYDIEVWLPGQQAYREISSCSNCGDFQARRAQIRSRRGGAGGDAKSKPKLVHTLNGSALAVGRTLVAVLENYQQADGCIAVPSVLQPYLGRATLTAEPMFAGKC